MEEFNIGDNVRFMFDNSMVNGTIVKELTNNCYMVSFFLKDKATSYTISINKADLTKVG